jgi:hypothetical protein
MTPLSAVLALLLAGAASGAARPCSPAKPDARVRVSFLADSDVATLAKWAKEATCVEYTYEPAVAGRRLAQGVILTVTGRDVGSIFEILLHTMNLRTYGRGARRAIVAAGPETPQSKAANERDRTDAERDKVLANIDGEIKRKDDGRYTITRRGADAIIASLPSIARTVRVSPETKAGRPIGYRVLSLKPGALLTHVGLQNGDVVLSLNGNHLTSPDKAFEAYTRFRTTGVMQASLLRANKPFALELRIE